MKKILGKVIYKITIITLVLGFLIQTISLFPFYVFANTEENIDEIAINTVNNVDEEDVKLLYEVDDKKDEYLKVFRRSDGKLEYAYYDELVNYFDGEKFIEVDASYKEENNEYSQVINKYSVKLPKKIHENKKIKLSFNNSSSIEITYNNISKVSGVVLENNNQSDKINELKNLSGSVVYNNIFDNVDLKIDSSGTKFKENIILNKYITDFSFSYNIKLQGLRLIYEEDNIIFKNEEGLIVYEISPYFMFDSNNNYSSDIEVKVELIKEDEYKFIVTPSDEYLSTATYPVTIDPVFSYYANSTSSSNIKIKTIQKGFTTCSVNSYLQLTKYIHTMGDLIEDIGYYGIMEVNLTNLPPLDNIDYAFIRLKGSSEFYSEKAVVRRITSHSYNSINGTTNYSTVSPVVKVENSGKKSYSIDFIDYYNFNKNTTCVYEISPENFTSNDTTQVYGNHLSATDSVPVLNIVSYDYDGLSSDRTYESVSAGDAGVVNIDNALGSSNLSIPVYSNNYLNLTHYYSQFSLNNDMFGNKINISLYEKLTNITDTSLCYINGTGYREYFYYDEESNRIYFHSGKVGHKLDAIAKSDKVSFCVYDNGYHKDGHWSLNIRSVIIFGRIRILDDWSDELMVKFCKRFTSDMDYIHSEIEKFKNNTAVLCLEIEHMTGKLVNEA